MSVFPAPRLARLAVLLLGLVVAACDGGGTDEETFSDDLVGRFQARDRYVPLADALALTGLDDDLRAGGPFTVLAPTRIALVYVGTDFSPVLFAEPQRAVLARVLRHHVVPGRLTPDDFADGAVLTAIDGTTLRVRRVGPVTTVNGVTVDLADPTEASNGVAYPVADVLVDVLTTAERVALSPLLSTYASGLRATTVQGQLDGLDRVTVLAPTNDAFAALPGGGPALLVSAANAAAYQRALRATVIPGDVDLGALVGQTVTTVGGAELAVTRDEGTGVLRVEGIRVLHDEATADGRLYVLAEPVLSVLSLDERLRIRADFSRYLADLGGVPAVQARLADRSAGLTVFAPSNFFYAARPDIATAIFQEPAQAPLVRRLAAVRVVEGRYARADLVDGLQLTTVDGTVLTVTRQDDDVFIDGRPLPAAEPARAANGLLYTADIRVIPDDLGLVETLIVTDRYLFYKAVQLAGLETAYRTTVRTAFAPPELFLRANGPFPPFSANPALPVIMSRTATTVFIPDLSALALPFTFPVLDGTSRQVVYEGCNEMDQVCAPPICGEPQGPDEPQEICSFNFERYPIPNPEYPDFCSPGDTPEECPPFLLVAGTRMIQGRVTSDGTAVIHELSAVDETAVVNRPFRAGR